MQLRKAKRWLKLLVLLPVFALYAQEIILKLNNEEYKAHRALMVELDIRIRNLVSLSALSDRQGVYYNFFKLTRLDEERPQDLQEGYTSLYKKWKRKKITGYMENIFSYAEEGRRYFVDLPAEESVDWSIPEEIQRKIIGECRGCHIKTEILR